MAPGVHAITHHVAELGEGPLWVPGERALFWIDIRGDLLLRYEPGADRTSSMRLPARPTSLVEHGEGCLLVTYKKGMALADFGLTGTREVPLAGIDFATQDCNDSACDGAGRLWLGTRDPSPAPSAPVGRLYRVGADYRARCMDEGFVISNGRAWSPDGRTLYHTDSLPGRIDAYDFDVSTGSIANRRVFLDYAGKGLRPDGCTVDADGCLWVAEVDGGRVARYSPQAELLSVIELPCRKPSSVMFGGEDLATLFVTTVRAGIDEAELAARPLAGALFAIDSGTRGLPEHRFATAGQEKPRP